MATVTTRFGLHKPEGSDYGETFRNNIATDMQTIDDDVMARVIEAVNTDLASFNATGDVVDSGILKANVSDTIAKKHEQNKDQYLDYGGSNQVTAADTKDAVTKKHEQHKDQYLDYGGSNQVAVADVKDAVTKKHETDKDDFLDFGGSNQVAAVDAKDAVTKKHEVNKDQYLDYGGTNQVAVADVKDAVAKKHTQASDDDFNSLTEDSAIASGDFLPYRKVSGSVYRKIKYTDLIGPRNYEVVFDGGLQAITSGTKFDISVDNAGSIKEYTLIGTPVAGQTVGSIQVDIWKCTYNQYDNDTHPIDSDSICASAPPAISSGVKAKDSTLTGWTKTLNSGDILRFYVESCTNMRQLTLVLRVEE